MNAITGLLVNPFLAGSNLRIDSSSFKKKWCIEIMPATWNLSLPVYDFHLSEKLLRLRIKTDLTFLSHSSDGIGAQSGFSVRLEGMVQLSYWATAQQMLKL